MSQRDQWEFNYTIKQVLVGATTKKAFHEGRLQWWRNKKEETIAAIKSDGLEVDDSIVNEMSKTGYLSNNTFAGRGPTVTIKDEYLRDLSECSSKISEHEGKIKAYDAWMQVLTDQKESDTLPLRHDDWMYFFGVK